MSIFNKTFLRYSFSLNQAFKYSTLNISKNVCGFEFKSTYSQEQELRILNIINESNADQLKRFNVSQYRIKNLVSWKSKKGPFKSLSEVLEVEGLGEKILQKICEDIITKNDEENNESQPVVNVTNNRRIKQLLTPNLPPKTELTTAVGIHLDSTGVSWAKIFRQDNKINDWNFENFSALPKKLFPTETCQLAISILRKIPYGDVYILEASSSISPQTSTQSTVSSYNQQLELISMLIALLNTSPFHNSTLEKNITEKPLENVQNKVYHLRSKIPARLFRTLVGTERVAALTSVSQLVDNTSLANFTLPVSPITMEEAIRNAFVSQSPANKELLGQALMLVVSFMDLCVYKNKDSYAALMPNKK